MKTVFQIAGIAGLVLVLFGSAAYIFTGNLGDPYVRVHFAVGGLCLLVYLVTQSRALIAIIRRRSFRYGLRSIFSTLLFVATLALLSFASTRYYARWDFTEAQVLSLSPQSVHVVGQLQQELTMHGFFDRADKSELARLVQNYVDSSEKIRFRAVDPARHPEMAREFKISRPNSLHLSYGGQTTNLTDPTEESITNAIIKLSRTGTRRVYFLTGHGGPAPQDRRTGRGFAAAKEALESQNYLFQELLLATRDHIPEDSSLLIVAGPDRPLPQREVAAIREYLNSGGRILILLPSTGGEDLKALLAEWGVEVGDDVVVDQLVRLFDGASLGVEPIVDRYSSDHPITRNFKERTIFSLVRSVQPAAAIPEGLQATPLAMTNSTSWAEQDVEGVLKQSRASLGPDDRKGPISIAVAVSGDGKNPGTETRGNTKLVVFGTPTFATNRYINIYFNRDFFLNVVDWLAGEEAWISIRPRSLRSSRLQLTQREANLVFYLSFLILPESLLITGMAVWWRRR